MRRLSSFAKQQTEKFVQVEGVAAMALFLCRDEATNMTLLNMQRPKRDLSADRYAGLQIGWADDLPDRSIGHQLDPQRIHVPVPGRLIRFA